MKRVFIISKTGFLLNVIVFILCNKLSSQCVNTFPYNEDFETTPSWTIAGANSDWAWGTPSHPTINSAGGGTKSWCVGGLSGSFYNNAEQASIVSPCFDFTNLNYPWISFKIFWECEFNYDGLVLQSSTNNGVTWTNVGAFGDPNDCNTANWFNHNNISKLSSIAIRNGWSGRIGPTTGGCQGGSGSGGWVIAKHCLTGLANQPNVIFRFLFGSGTTCNNFDGIALDDILISNGIKNSANFNYSCSGAGNYNFNAVPASCPVPGLFTWDFGDPMSGASNISSLLNPSHVFSAPGIYNVSLIVKGGQCNPPDTIYQTISVANISIPLSQNITCFGMNNGNASISIISGTGPYTYTWLPSGGNSSAANNLSAGNYSVTINDGSNCSYTKTLSITEPPVLTITVSSSNASCGLANGGATVAAYGGTGAYSYLWQPTGGTSLVQSNLNTGNYSILVTDANNCTASQNLIINQTPAMSLTVNSLTLCNNQSGNLSANVVGGTAPYSYNWNGTITAVGNLPVTGGGNAIYPVLVTDANGCISNPDTAKLSAISPLIINVSPNDTICSGSSAVLFANSSGGNGIYNYVWMPGGSTSPTLSVSPLTPKTYSVKVTDGCGSIQTGIISVNIYTVLVSSFNASSTSGCQPLCIDFSDLTLLAGGTINSWNWSFGDSTSSQTAKPNHCYQKSGIYTVKLSYITNKGCTGSQTISNYINVFPKPKADFNANTFEVDVYNTTIDFYNQSQGAIIYNWMFGSEASSSQQNPSYSFKAEGYYKVMLVVENSFGCWDSISKDIYVRPDFTFYAPNAFTPNEDGLNERFLPKGAGWDINEYELYVFDRWGEKIFHTKQYDEGWNGRVNGKGEIVENGVYVWKVIVTDVFKKQHQFTGHITLNK